MHFYRTQTTTEYSTQCLDHSLTDVLSCLPLPLVCYLTILFSTSFSPNLSHLIFHFPIIFQKSFFSSPPLDTTLLTSLSPGCFGPHPPFSTISHWPNSVFSFCFSVLSPAWFTLLLRRWSHLVSLEWCNFYQNMWCHHLKFQNSSAYERHRWMENEIPAMYSVYYLENVCTLLTLLVTCFYFEFYEFKLHWYLSWSNHIWGEYVTFQWNCHDQTSSVTSVYVI
jgi:hypothetical protein